MIQVAAFVSPVQSSDDRSRNVHQLWFQVSESVTFPIDAVKTRMQFGTGERARFATTLVRTVKLEGGPALYR